ncbi:hypothetical protein L2E82_00290 [Cichorium intybus]|uniref:Uncharacterized protein n=1 Tax=Cichorium intybus TaxID=13427 RepID=A0ACB9GWV2_CICIN|nr:hypothetical protein L2E82_00290 [Cichorium intybus]
MSFELEEEESFEHTLLVVREVSVFKIPPRSTGGGYKCGEWLQSDKIWSGRLRVVSCLGFTERNEAFDFNVALSDHDKHVKRENEKEDGEASDASHIDIHPAVNHRLKEGETIRISVKNKPASGAGMLTAAGTGKIKPLSLAPPPASTTRIRSPLPPPPNDTAAVRITSTKHSITVEGTKETAKHSMNAFTDLSPLEKNLPSMNGTGSTKSKSGAAGWAAF